MKKITDLLGKFTLVALVLTIALAAMPLSTASAAGMKEDGTPPTNTKTGGIRLAAIWARLQKVYERQGQRLERGNALIVTIQSRIDQASQNGKDTSAIQAALDVFAQALKNANPIHQSAQEIITSHNGFDDNGKVTDRAQARETIQSLGQSLKDARSLVKDPFNLLREAIKAFREANRTKLPTSNPTP
jgi:hypothetical protein